MSQQRTLHQLVVSGERETYSEGMPQSASLKVEPTEATSFAVATPTPGNIYQLPEREYRPKPQGLSPVDRAYDYIRHAAADDVRQVERSNSFDQWKDALSDLSELTGKTSIQQNQLLGMLITAVHKKDVTDFNAETLHAFSTITNLLRKPKQSDLHVSYAARLLRKARLNLFIPIDANMRSEGEEAELEAMMKDIIEKAQKRNE